MGETIHLWPTTISHAEYT